MKKALNILSEKSLGILIIRINKKNCRKITDGQIRRYNEKIQIFILNQLKRLQKSYQRK